MQIEWVHQVFVSKKAAITFAYTHLPISVHNDRHFFREWFCNSDANRHEICMRLRQRVEN